MMSPLYVWRFSPALMRLFTDVAVIDVADGSLGGVIQRGECS